MKDKLNKGLYICSFCGKDQSEVQQIITGPAVNICNECVDLCHEIILDKRRENYRDTVRTECFNELWGTD